MLHITTPNSNLRQLAFAILYMFCFSLDAIGQDVYYENYNSRNGMTNGACFEVHQDAKGFIWVTTNTGVERFDGTSFRNFTEKDGFTGSLVRTIKEDLEGRVWVSTFFNGLFHTTEPSGTVFEPYSHNHLVQKLGTVALDFDFDENNGLVLEYATRHVLGLHTDQPMYRMYAEPEVIFHIPAHERCYAVHNAPMREVVRFHDGDTIRCKLPGNGIDIGSRHPVYIDDNTLAYGSYLIRFAGKGCLVDTLPESIVAAAILSDGDYLLGTSSGLWRYNTLSKESRLLVSEVVVSDILLGAQGNIWFTSIGGGLFKIPSLEIFAYELTSGFTTKLTGFVQRNTDKVGVYSNVGLYEQTGPRGEFQNVFTVNDPATLIRDVLEREKNGEKLIVCNYGQPNFWRIKDGKCIMKRQFIKGQQLHRGSFRGDKLYLTGSVGAYEYHIDQDSIVPMQPSSLVARCHSLKEDSKGIFWFAGKGAIYKETKNGLQSVFDFDELVVDLDFCEDRLVIATQKAGLYLLDTASMEMIGLREEQGLSSDMMINVMVHENRIYASTRGGIDIVTKDGDDWKVAKAYLNSFSNNTGANDMLVVGDRIWLCLNHKLVSVPLQNTYPSFRWPVQVTQVSANGKLVDREEASFDYGDNDISVSFKEANFLKLDGDKYLYRLLGAANESWTSVSGDQLTFPSLRSGDYEFQIKPNPEYQSTTGENISSFTFSIRPPFWNAWWFICFEVLAVLLIVWLVIRVRSSQIANKEALKTELIRLELKALKAQINPHFVYNAISSVQYYLAKNLPSEAQEYMGDFAHLIRKVLEHSNKSLIPLESELGLIRNYVDLEAKKFEGAGLVYKQEVSADVNVDEVRIPPSLFQPFVENAIFHGLKNKRGNKVLTLRVAREQRNLLIEIEDNGIGRKTANKKSVANHKGPSFGISIASERIQALNGAATKEVVRIKDLVGDKGQALGTRVILSIPYISLAS